MNKMKTRIKFEEIRNFMWENKMTINEFCEKSGISYGILRKALNGDINMMASSFFKICRFIKKHPKDMFITEK